MTSQGSSGGGYTCGLAHYRRQFGLFKLGTWGRKPVRLPFIMFIIMSGLDIIISCGERLDVFCTNTPVSCVAESDKVGFHQ